MSYERAIKCFCDDLEKDVPDHQGSDGNASEHQHHPSSHNLRLRLGTFAIEKSEQVFFAKRVVAKELERLRVGAQEAANESDPESIQNVLLGHLIKRLTETIRIIAE